MGEGDGARDGCSTGGLALDGEGAAEDAGAILHDAKPHAGGLGEAGWDALAVVADVEAQRVRGLGKVKGEATGLAMAQGVGHGLLRDAVQVGGHLDVGQEDGLGTLEVHVNVEVVGGADGEFLEGGHEAVRGGPQGGHPVGQVAGVFGGGSHEGGDLVGGGRLGSFGVLEAAGEGLGEELDAGELLAEVVVQVLSDALLGNLGDAEDLGLEASPLGDVAEDAGEEASLSDVELADGQVDGEDGSVLAAAEDLAADADDAALAGLAVAGEVAVMSGAVGLGHEGADVASEEISRGPSEHAFGGRVDGVDEAAVVDGDDALDGGVEDGAEAGVAVLEGKGGLGFWVGFGGVRNVGLVRWTPGPGGLGGAAASLWSRLHVLAP